MFKGVVKSKATSWQNRLSDAVIVQLDDFIELLTRRVFRHADLMQRASIGATVERMDSHDAYLKLANRIDHDGFFVTKLFEAFLRFSMSTWNEPRDEVDDYIADFEEDVEDLLLEFGFGDTVRGRDGHSRETSNEMVDELVATLYEEFIERTLLTNMTEMISKHVPSSALINLMELNVRKSTISGRWNADLLISYD